jgi:hypothetical protein
VLTLFMALLSFRGISTPSLPAQGGQRRFSYFNIQRGNPPGAAGVGYFNREFYKARSRPQRSLAQSGVLEVSRVQLIPGLKTP